MNECIRCGKEDRLNIKNRCEHCEQDMYEAYCDAKFEEMRDKKHEK